MTHAETLAALNASSSAPFAARALIEVKKIEQESPTLAGKSWQWVKRMRISPESPTLAGAVDGWPQGT